MQSAGSVGMFSAMSGLNSSQSLSDPSDMSSLLLHNSFQDSGVYDVTRANIIDPIILSDYQEAMLGLWYEENRRGPTRTEAFFFHCLLKAPQEHIKKRLLQLVDNDKTVEAPTKKQDIEMLGENPDREPMERQLQDSFGFVSRFKDHTHLPTLGAGTLSSGEQTLTQDKPYASSGLLINDSNTNNDAEFAHYRSYDSRNTAGPVLSSSKGPAVNVQDQVAFHTPKPFYDISSLGLFFPCGSKVATLSGSSSVGTAHSFSQSHPFDISSPATDIFQAPFANALNIESASSRPPVRMSCTLETFIASFRASRLARCCGPIRDCEKQDGHFECTLRCKRRFKTVCDLIRHEETVFPQEFYYCTRCGNPNDPSVEHLFTRRDKLRDHNKRVHKYLGPFDDCKVPNVPAVFPGRCNLCTHVRHRTWKDRRRHILWHYEQGHTIPKYLPESCGKHPDADQVHGDDNDSDSDDDDDRDHDHDDPSHNGNDSGNNEDGANGGSDHDPTNEKPPHFNHDQGNGDYNDHSYEPDDHYSIFDFDSFPPRTLKTKISLNPLRRQSTEECARISSQQCIIHWKERVNQKGGTASVFKVELMIDGGCLAGLGNSSRVVKQYSSQHYHLFEKELRAFSCVGLHPNIVTCFGSFVLEDRIGVSTYNLLLEGAQSDLYEFFADNPPPENGIQVRSFWTQLSNVGAALRYIHKNEQFSGWHADVKPDNILYINDKLKLADFGFSKFVPRGFESSTKAILSGGTAMYGAPEIRRSSTAKAIIPVSHKVDIWSFGCVFSLAAAWVAGGFLQIQEFEERLKEVQRQSKSGFAVAFHDGERTHPEIKKWHDDLRKHVPAHDDITSKILDLVDDHLLQPDPAHRYNSTQMCSHLKRIFKQPGKQVKNDLPIYVEHCQEYEKYHEVTAATASFTPLSRGNEALTTALRESTTFKLHEILPPKRLGITTNLKSSSSSPEDPSETCNIARFTAESLDVDSSNPRLYRENKKVSGAYYNAVAHLRRTHFHPRTRVWNGIDDETYGGTSDDDIPPPEKLTPLSSDNLPSPNHTGPFSDLRPCSASQESHLGSLSTGACGLHDTMRPLPVPELAKASGLCRSSLHRGSPYEHGDLLPPPTLMEQSPCLRTVCSTVTPHISTSLLSSDLERHGIVYDGSLSNPSTSMRTPDENTFRFCGSIYDLISLVTIYEALQLLKLASQSLGPIEDLTKKMHWLIEEIGNLDNLSVGTSAGGNIDGFLSRLREDSEPVKDRQKDRQRNFPCPLATYGCPFTFSSKQEWTRHVSTQHIKSQLWRCDPRAVTPYNQDSFNRKYLFIKHLRRMRVIFLPQRIVQDGDPDDDSRLSSSDERFLGSKICRRIISLPDLLGSREYTGNADTKPCMDITLHRMYRLGPISAAEYGDILAGRLEARIFSQEQIMLKELDRALDQYLSGRQERMTWVDVVTKAEWSDNTFASLEKLIEDFSRSKRRRVDRDNLRIRFVEDPSHQKIVWSCFNGGDGPDSISMHAGCSHCGSFRDGYSGGIFEKVRHLCSCYTFLSMVRREPAQGRWGQVCSAIELDSMKLTNIMDRSDHKDSTSLDLSRENSFLHGEFQSNHDKSGSLLPNLRERYLRDRIIEFSSPHGRVCLHQARCKHVCLCQVEDPPHVNLRKRRHACLLRRRSGDVSVFEATQNPLSADGHNRKRRRISQEHLGGIILGALASG